MLRVADIDQADFCIPIIEVLRNAGGIDVLKMETKCEKSSFGGKLDCGKARILVQERKARSGLITIYLFIHLSLRGGVLFP